jgi:hypothetical protein
MRPQPLRTGAILILVAGVTGLLTSLAIAFILRMRSDAEEMTVAMREVQARSMLVAACNYVLEGGRVGYDLPDIPTRPSPQHEEAFGWIDVRDGRLGPRTRDYTGLPSGLATDPPDGIFDPCFDDLNNDGEANDSGWPSIGGAARCPMHVLERPPYAASLTVAYNPINTVTSDPDFGMPYLRNPEPLPAVNTWMAYETGDRRPRATSTAMSWFRVYRDGPATFVVTCGGGATMGFRDWPEVVAQGEQAQFYFDQDVFQDALAAEIRLWYRIEWSPSVPAPDHHLIDNEVHDDREHYQSWPVNASEVAPGAGSQRSVPHQKNALGTIRWVQRLFTPPRDGKW